MEKVYNKQSMQLFGDLDILSFVRISQLNWIGDLNRMESKRKVSPVLNNNPQGRLGRRRRRRRRSKLSANLYDIYHCCVYDLGLCGKIRFS